MEGPMKNLFDPAGKVALVTGGTSGLGHAIAEAFLQNGVDVAVCSRHPESAPELAELAAAEGRRYLPVYCDITKEEDVEKMGDIIEKELGPVTMLVNSAGMNILKHAEDYDAESFNKVMSLNVLGTHNVSKMCGKRWMIPAHKGRIVNLSSAKAFLGTDRDYTAYCASKGAINMYTAQLACEWAKFGSRCTGQRTCSGRRCAGCPSCILSGAACQRGRLSVCQQPNHKSKAVQT